MPHILVDADACPVKEEVYKVAYRRAVPVTIVSNQRIRAFDAADDWIAAQGSPDTVVTADILLAYRCTAIG